MGARLKPLHRTKAAEGDGSEMGARLKPLRRTMAAEGDGREMGAPAGWWGEVKRREGVSKWILTHPLSVGVI